MKGLASLAAPVLSEDIAQAVRRRDYDEAARLSPLVACLFALLEGLGWRDHERAVVEALPHHATHFDLVDLRNLLANLGYESHATPVRPGRVDARLLPGLFVGDDGTVLAVQGTAADGALECFDGRTRSSVRGPLPCAGTLYVFTDTRAAAPSGVRDRWFRALLRRFHRLFLHLAAMTFWLNVTTIAVPLFIMAVYDQVIGVGAITSLPWLLAGIGLALAMELGLRLLRARTLGHIAGRIDYLVGTASFRQLLGLAPILTERSPLAAQLGKLRQFDNLRDFFAGSAMPALLEAPFLPLFLVVIAMLGGWLALIPVASALLYGLIALLWLPRMRLDLQRAANGRTQREQLLMETFAGLRELKALGAEEDWLARYGVCCAESVASSRAAVIDQAVLGTATTTVTALAAVAMLGFGTLSVMAGDMSVGALIATMTLLWRVQAPMQGLFMACFRFEAIAAGVRDLDQLMAMPVERRGRKSMLLANEIEGRITFDRVSFRYGPECDPALLGVSFEVPARAFVAVVGPNGSGKSTVLKLVAALYPIASGTVYVDGIDTRQFDAGDLRRLVAYVPQQPNLFRGTIAQNLRFKDPLATDEDLRLACFKAGILRAVESLRDGFNTVVGDQGTLRLPGSLARGICIARALVRRSPILLLDEPASGLDMDSDEALMLQLQSIRHQVTVLMTSHRPSHIRMADRVIVMDRGVMRRLCTPEEHLAPAVAPGGHPHA